jgi:hypothetical protein
VITADQYWIFPMIFIVSYTVSCLVFRVVRKRV